MSWRGYLCEAPSTASTECGISRTAHHDLRGHRFMDLGEPRRTIVLEMLAAWKDRNDCQRRMEAAAWDRAGSEYWRGARASSQDWLTWLRRARRAAKAAA